MPEALLIAVTVPRVVDLLVIPTDALALVDQDDREVNVMKVEGVEFEVDFVAKLIDMLVVAELGTAFGD